MGIQDLKQNLGGTAVVEKQFPQMIQQLERQVALALPKHLSAERMSRIALTAFRQNPDLGKCEPRSVFASVVVAAQMGLEPNIMGQGFLVPYNNRKTGRKECQFIPGWKGLVDIAQRSGRASVWTGAVHEGDEFDYAYGVAPHINHLPGDEDEESKLTYVYAVGWVKGAEYPVIEVWKKSKVIKHRNKYNKVGDKHYSFTNFEMYARKVVLLQVLKYMPMSIELAAAMNLEDAADRGVTRYDLDEAIAGDFNVMASEGGEPEPEPTPPADDKKSPLVNTGEASEQKTPEKPDKPQETSEPSIRTAPVRGWTEQEMLEALKACTNLTELRATWNEFPDELPPSVEPAFKDRETALAQGNARSANPLGSGKGKNK
jgi:recombination protein RecT